MKHRLLCPNLALGIVLSASVAASASRAAVTISEDATQNMTCSGGVCAPTAPDAVLNVMELADMLAASDVKVVSDSAAMDIRLKAPLSWTNTSRLTLDAYRSVEIHKPIIVEGAGGLALENDDGGSGGSISFVPKHGHVEFWYLSSSLTINC